MAFSVLFAMVTPSERYCCPSLKTLKSVHHLHLWAQRESFLESFLVCIDEHEETGVDTDHWLTIWQYATGYSLLFLFSEASWFQSALLISSGTVCRFWSTWTVSGKRAFGNWGAKIRQTRRNCTLAWELLQHKIRYWPTSLMSVCFWMWPGFWS